MEHEVPASVCAEIESLIADAASPDSIGIGIDAKKTHIIIIHKLLQIEQRLDKLERMAADKDK